MQKTYPLKFSVAMTTYNHAKYLAKSLDSILAQQHDYSFEIVISDDCSTDNTAEIILSYHKKYPDIIIPILHKKNIGVAKNSLHNIRACRGEYIVTIDGDDYWTEPNKLKWQISFLDENPQYVLSCHRFKRLFEDTQQFKDDFHPELFEYKPDGFEFGTETFFKYWLTQTLTVVFRSSTLDNTPQLETFQYCWDTQIFWTVLTKGKAYIHNFFGGVYAIHSKGNWNGDDELKQDAVNYLVIEELLKETPDNEHIQNIFQIYRNKLLFVLTENRTLLDLEKVNNKNFSIISDDGWADEVYKAFGIEQLTPFIGMHIFNADFVGLVSNFEYYMSESLQFISVEKSKHVSNFKQNFGNPYPIALLGEKIELHFTDYKSQVDAENKWNERIKKINWNNLFFKMDASREVDNLSEIIAFNNIDRPNKTCFLSVFHRKKILEEHVKDGVIIIDSWNPEPEILFPVSLKSFNLMGWLQGENPTYTLEKPFSHEIFKTVDIRDLHFIQFNKDNADLIDSLFFPHAYLIKFNEAAGSVTIDYNKAGLEYFHLVAKEKLYRRILNLFISLKHPEDRHIFILAKAEQRHKLRIDFVAKDERDVDTLLHTSGLEQEISTEFEWIHFDFSMIQTDLEYLFSRIRGFCFYINPEEQAKGRIEIMAFFAGPIEKLEEILK